MGAIYYLMHPRELRSIVQWYVSLGGTLERGETRC